MKKILVLLFMALTLSPCVHAQVVMGSGGVVFVSPIPTATTSFTWDEQFSGSKLATEVWFPDLGATTASVTQKGDGYCRLFTTAAAGSPTAPPVGIYRLIPAGAGDFTAIAKFDFNPTLSGQYAQLFVSGIAIGWPSAQVSTVARSNNGGTQTTYRGNYVNGVWSNGGFTTWTQTAPIYLKLVRTGSSIQGYYSSDGASWNQSGAPTAVTLNASEPEVLGLAGGAGASDLVATITVDFIKVTFP